MTRPPPVRYPPDMSLHDPRSLAPRLVLASGSPRRRELLAAAGIDFEVVPADIPEELGSGEQPVAFATRLAREKALAVAERLPDVPDRPVLAADTIVVCDDEVLGKPRDEAHAVALLSKIVGRSHVVVTGVAITRTGTPDTSLESLHVASEVTMRAAGRDEIARYVAGGEPMDKAGAYAIQGEGRTFVVGVEGSETNVIGLPMEETLELLARAGVEAAPARETNR